MKGVKFTNNRESPDLANEINLTAGIVSGNAVTVMINMCRVHPVTGICCLIDHLSEMLRGMDETAANEVLKDLTVGPVRPDVQQEAMAKLYHAYEAQIEHIEHQENGGAIQ